MFAPNGTVYVRFGSTADIDARQSGVRCKAMLEHIILAVVIQAAVFLLLKDWGAGAAAAVTWSISREITQAEYRWIEHYGGGVRANMPVWGGFDLRVWQYPDPWLDWIVPTLVTMTIVVFVRTRAGRNDSTARDNL